MFILKNNKGMSFSLVLIIMTVLSILGLVVLQMSLADTTHAAHDNKRMQAYYIARSGVEATTAWMLDPTNSNAPNLVGKTSSPTAFSASGVSGTVEVEVVDKSTSEILVKGTGTVDGVSAKAALVIHKSVGNNTTPVFGGTIVATNNVVLSGNTTINGNVLAQNGITENGKSLTVTGSMDGNATVIANPVVFPADPSTASDITYSGNIEHYMDINADPDKMLVYKKLTMQNGILKIYTGTTGTIVKLVVEELDLQNKKVELVGDGTIHLFVKKQANFKCDINETQAVIKFMTFLDSGCSATLNGNRTINMFVYGPQATVTVSGNEGFSGAILAQTIDVSGNPIAADPADGSSITLGDLPVLFYSRGPWVKP